jgi:hypothetical protein
MRMAPHAANCRWATPTLLLPEPLWLSSWECPWSCVRDAEVRVLRETEECVDCPRWEPHRFSPRERL